MPNTHLAQWCCRHPRKGRHPQQCRKNRRKKSHSGEMAPMTPMTMAASPTAPHAPKQNSRGGVAAPNTMAPSITAPHEPQNARHPWTGVLLLFISTLPTFNTRCQQEISEKPWFTVQDPVRCKACSTRPGQGVNAIRRDPVRMLFHKIQSLDTHNSLPTRNRRETLIDGTRPGAVQSLFDETRSGGECCSTRPSANGRCTYFKMNEEMVSKRKGSNQNKHSSLAFKWLSCSIFDCCVI